VRIVLQRVSAANVVVNDAVVGKIKRGLLALVGVGHEDTEEDARWLAAKTAELRIFPDEQDKMNRSLIDIGGSVLVISQFTLLGDCRKGRRPAFTDAGPPELAKQLYLRYAELVAEHGVHVERGIFAADMKVSLVNDGPVTMVIDRAGSSGSRPEFRTSP
jgi:D-tyrosyl-tRNA(Tyr) deacylase